MSPLIELYVLGCAGVVALGALPALWALCLVWPGRGCHAPRDVVPHKSA